MMDISDTLQAKSDQLNADDLSAPITVKVTGVNKTSTDQPITIKYDGDQGRPFKPCKTVRRILAKAWGRDASQWTGRLMTLYCDPNVKWAGKPVGGIRVSHLSHIDGPLEINLAVTRGAKQIHKVSPIAGDAQTQGAPALANPPPADPNKPDNLLKLVKSNGSIVEFEDAEKWLGFMSANLPKIDNIDRVNDFSQKHQEIFEALKQGGFADHVQKAEAIIEESRKRLGGDDGGL